jgi:hypothetical protein
VPKVTLNQICYVAIILNICIFYVGTTVTDKNMQLLSLFNLLALTLGILLRPVKKKEDE